MEGLAAISLAGNILQFVQFTHSLISCSKRIAVSSQGTLPEHVELSAIAKDLVQQAQLLRVKACLANSAANDTLQRQFESCIAIAQELMSALDCMKVKGRRKLWPTFKAALLSVWKQPEVDSLQRRLDAVLQSLQLNGWLSVL